MKPEFLAFRDALNVATLNLRLMNLHVRTSAVPVVVQELKCAGINQAEVSDTSSRLRNSRFDAACSV